VDDREVERARGQLSQGIDEAIQLLRSVGESFWATRLAAGRSKLEAHGVDWVLGLFGGMGGFNDLVLLPMDGCAVSEVDIRAANERLWDLRNEIYTAAKELRRALPS
jgi:hypothetical protein